MLASDKVDFICLQLLYVLLFSLWRFVCEAVYFDHVAEKAFAKERYIGAA